MADDIAPFAGELEHAGLARLLRYWRRIGGGALPSRSDLDPIDIPDLLKNLVLVDVEHAPVRFRVRLSGTRVDDMFGRNYTGCYLDDIHSGYFERDILQDYAEVVALKRPHLASRSILLKDASWLHYERLLLPLSSDGLSVDMLLGGVFGEFAETAESAA